MLYRCGRLLLHVNKCRRLLATAGPQPESGDQRRSLCPRTHCKIQCHHTAPAEAKIELDNSGKTVDTVVIGDGDGTGTELTIPAGTPITLPPNSDSVGSYKAPILEAASAGKPPQGEFTQVQRDLSPAGLTFGGTVVLTCQYTKQER